MTYDSCFSFNFLSGGKHSDGIEAFSENLGLAIFDSDCTFSILVTTSLSVNEPNKRKITIRLHVAYDITTFAWGCTDILVRPALV